jgi:hypothetical protein
MSGLETKSAGLGRDGEQPKAYSTVVKEKTKAAKDDEGKAGASSSTSRAFLAGF